MITPVSLHKYDKSEMHKIYDMWPDLAKKFFNMSHDSIDLKSIDHIVFVGMGGSGTIGDILSSILSKSNIHICVVKGYHLPKTVDASTLVVASSVSGNTLETVTVLDQAKKLGAKITAFSSGGKIEKYCNKNKIYYQKVPMLNSPRASLPIYLYSILNILAPIIPIKKNDVINSITSIEQIKKKISSKNLNENNPSIDVASWISGIPVIYYPMGLRSVATRFKNSLQENAKMHVFAEDVLEACHNGIVAWERQSKVKPILIQGRDDYIKTKELWKIIEEYFKIHTIDYKIINSMEGNILSKIMHLIYLLDYASIYKAILDKIDPTPVSSIDYVKNKFSN